MIDELERLVKLWQMGALTDEEFAAAKQRLLTPQPTVEPESQPAVATDLIVPEELEAAPAEAAPAAEDDLPFDDLDAMLDSALDDLPPLGADPAPAQETTGPAADDALSFDDLDAMLEDGLADLPRPDEQIAAGPASPTVEAAADDDVLFDDLNAMLDDGLADLPPLEDETTADAAPTADAVEPDGAEAPQADDEILFDDLNAMLDDGLADLSPLEDDEAAVETPLAEIEAPSTAAPAADSLSLDDLDAMLADGLADLPALDETAEETPQAAAMDAEAEPALPTASADEPGPGIYTELPTDDDLLFDDLNAMLDESLADLPPLEDAAPAEMAADIGAPSGAAAASASDDHLLFDDLNAMLDDSLADLPPLEDAAPAETATDIATPPVATTEPAADDELLFDDLNAMLDDGLADLPPIEAAAPAEPAAPSGKSALVEHAELLADDLDMVLEEAPADPAGESAAEAPSAEDAGAAEAEPAPDEASPKRARLKFPLAGMVAARMAKLPPPVRLGIGGASLFFGAMIIGVALALATAGHPEEGEATAAHGEDSAETASAHGEESTPETPSPEAEPVAASQTAYDPRDVMRQCAAINAMSEDFGTALAEHRKVPIQSLTVITGTGYVRTAAHAPRHKSCVVAFEMKTGPRQCKVDAVVRFPDGDVGAHLGERRRIICEGDAGFDT